MLLLTGNIIFLAIIAVAVVVVCVIIWAISVLNGFKRKEIKIEESLSDIEVALTKRYDMLKKLFDSAKGYMKNERELYRDVIALRKGMSVDELNKAQRQIGELSGNLFAVAENYPELKSSGLFIELQRGIKDCEEHLQAARRLYNSNVSLYNTALAVFPSSLLAGGRRPKSFFEAEESKKQDIDMSF